MEKTNRLEDSELTGVSGGTGEDDFVTVMFTCSKCNNQDTREILYSEYVWLQGAIGQQPCPDCLETGGMSVQLL